MSIENLIDRFVELNVNARLKLDEKKEKQDKEKALNLHEIKFERNVKELMDPAKKKGEHHREREKHYTKVLEEAEKELREKGVSMEVYDPTTGTYQNVNMGPNGGGFQLQGATNTSVSATATPLALASGGLGYFTSNQAQFQPRIDQRLLDNVKNAKNKMLDHRSKALDYEKWARTFTCCPQDMKIVLTPDLVVFFGLES